MVITFAAQAAVTPAGMPVAAPIPVAPVVVCVMLVSAELMQSVGVEEAALAVLLVKVYVRPAGGKLVFLSCTLLAFEVPGIEEGQGLGLSTILLL
jgi:hypothetical protein